MEREKKERREDRSVREAVNRTGVYLCVVGGRPAGAADAFPLSRSSTPPRTHLVVYFGNMWGQKDNGPALQWRAGYVRAGRYSIRHPCCVVL
jgi:hypothetical protein